MAGRLLRVRRPRDRPLPAVHAGGLADYPAHLEVKYPERLSRGLVLVKWWLLAIPQYLVVGLFSGGLWTASQQGDSSDLRFTAGGLIGLLVLFAAISLLFRDRYPRAIFDFVLGMHRRSFRVTAYAALMTDVYPPFRLDQGGSDPGTVVQGSAPIGPR